MSWNLRTNRISIKRVNHNGWIYILVIKKLLFLFVFSTYLPVFLLKFWSGDLVGCGIWFPIQRVPTLHTFDGPCYPKNKKYLKKMWWWCHHHIFQVFLVFWVAGSSKVCWVGTHWMRNLIPHPTSSPDRNLSKNTGRYVENTNTKSSFFLSSSKINQYYFIILTIILWIHFRRPILSGNFL